MASSELSGSLTFSCLAFLSSIHTLLQHMEATVYIVYNKEVMYALTGYSELTIFRHLYSMQLAVWARANGYSADNQTVHVMRMKVFHCHCGITDVSQMPKHICFSY